MSDEPRPLRRPPPRPVAPAAPSAPPLPAEPIHTARTLGPVQLILTADVTIPATAGYARRLANLIASLEQSVREEAPWLTNVEVTVDRR